MAIAALRASLVGAAWKVDKDRVKRVWRREGLKVPAADFQQISDELLVQLPIRRQDSLDAYAFRVLEQERRTTPAK